MNYPDYPNNPIVNQEFTLPSGITMKWDGEKWKVVPIPSDDTLRQDLAVEDSTVSIAGITAADLVNKVVVRSKSLQEVADTFTGVNGEITVVTDAEGKARSLRLHDGATVGGLPISGDGAQLTNTTTMDKILPARFSAVTLTKVANNNWVMSNIP
jgi:hypothetical protein